MPYGEIADEGTAEAGVSVPGVPERLGDVNVCVGGIRTCSSGDLCEYPLVDCPVQEGGFIVCPVTNVGPSV